MKQEKLQQDHSKSTTKRTRMKWVLTATWWWGNFKFRVCTLINTVSILKTQETINELKQANIFCSDEPNLIRNKELHCLRCSAVVLPKGRTISTPVAAVRRSPCKPATYSDHWHHVSRRRQMWPLSPVGSQAEWQHTQGSRIGRLPDGAFVPGISAVKNPLLRSALSVHPQSTWQGWERTDMKRPLHSAFHRHRHVPPKPHWNKRVLSQDK